MTGKLLAILELMLCMSRLHFVDSYLLNGVIIVPQDLEDLMAAEAALTGLTSPLSGDWDSFLPSDAELMAPFANPSSADEELVLQEIVHRVQETTQQGSDVADWRDLAIDTMSDEELGIGEGYVQIDGGVAHNGGGGTGTLDGVDGDFVELNDLVGPVDLRTYVHPAIQLRLRPVSSDPLVASPSDLGTARRRVFLQRRIPELRVPTSISELTDNSTSLPALPPIGTYEFGGSALSSLHTQRFDVRKQDPEVAQSFFGSCSRPPYSESEVRLT